MGETRIVWVALGGDIRHRGVYLASNEWDQIIRRCNLVDVKAGDNIQNQSRVADNWVFLSQGIAASEQTWPDGAFHGFRAEENQGPINPGSSPIPSFRECSAPVAPSGPFLTER